MEIPTTLATTPQELEFRILLYAVIGLMAIASALFAAVIWYFKNDSEETKKMNALQTKRLDNHDRQLSVQLGLIENNQRQTDKALKILARKTKTDIGL